MSELRGDVQTDFQGEVVGDHEIGLRAWAALYAATLGTFVCFFQHHVHVVLSDLGTWGMPFHHKCSLMMVAGVSWMLAELGVMAHGEWKARRAGMVEARFEAAMARPVAAHVRRWDSGREADCPGCVHRLG